LILAVSTNGTLSPKHAVAIASKFLISHFELFANLLNNTELENISNLSSTTKKTSTHISTPISELNLSSGASNALSRGGIMSVNELTELSLIDVKAIDGLGSRYTAEIKKALTDKGLSFKKKK
jgi:DNA-directed RNA polymerase subunit alpha